MEIKQYIERIIRLKEEEKEIKGDIRELFKQAKGEGHSVKALKQVLKLQGMAKTERDELLYLVEQYSAAIGI